MSSATISILAMAPSGEQGGLFSMAFPMIMIFAIMYFLLIAPQRRKQKKHAEMLGNLKNGDKVITQGGLYGVVTGVGEQVVQIRIADGVKIEVAKHAVAGLQNQPGE